MRSLLSRTVCLWLAIVVFGPGCNGGRPPVDTSTTEATVTGTVKIRGKPVTEGNVSFDPSNVVRKGEPVRTAPIGKDGGYTVKTLVGQNMVSFAGRAFDKDPDTQQLTIPYKVQSGEQTYNIELPQGTAAK